MRVEIALALSRLTKFVQLMAQNGRPSSVFCCMAPHAGCDIGLLQGNPLVLRLALDLWTYWLVC